jgi:hypothetical protein
MRRKVQVIVVLKGDTSRSQKQLLAELRILAEQLIASVEYP